MGLWTLWPATPGKTGADRSRPDAKEDFCEENREACAAGAAAPDDPGAAGRGHRDIQLLLCLLLRADGAVEASWWPHNRALLYQNLPWIVALYLLSFLAGGLYHVLWKYAGERDLIRLGGMIAVPTGVV